MSDELLAALITEVRALQEKVNLLAAREVDRRHSSGTPIYPALTTGRVVFVGSSEQLADDAELVWDATNKRLGIGTSPGAKLEVTDGYIRALDGDNAPPASGMGVEIVATGGSGFIVCYDRSGGSYERMLLNADPLLLNAASGMGNVGIGTTPSQKFHVVGNSRFDGVIGINRVPASTISLLVLSPDNTNATWSLAARNASDSLLMGVRGDGTLFANQNWTITSDERLKDEIEDLTDAATVVKQLKPRQYRLRQRDQNGDEVLSTRQHYGFVAQELQEVLPDLVEETPEGLGIRYGELIPVLTKALTEALERIENLEEEVARLRR